MLNNHGWGFRAYMIASGILLIALILVAFLVTRLYSGLPSLETAMENTKTYSTIENDIKAFAHSYIVDYHQEEITTGVVTVSTNKLIEKGFLTDKKLTTSDGDKCKGYALIRKDNDVLVVEPYIKCKNYTTVGYQSWRLVDE